MTKRNMLKSEVDALTREFIDAGVVIAAGWEGYKTLTNLPDDADPRIEEAFFAGANHLSRVSQSMLEKGNDITEKDIDRILKVEDELNRFNEKFLLKYDTADGNG